MGSLCPAIIRKPKLRSVTAKYGFCFFKVRGGRAGFETDAWFAELNRMPRLLVQKAGAQFSQETELGLPFLSNKKKKKIRIEDSLQILGIPKEDSSSGAYISSPFSFHPNLDPTSAAHFSRVTQKEQTSPPHWLDSLSVPQLRLRVVSFKTV